MPVLATVTVDDIIADNDTYHTKPTTRDRGLTPMTLSISSAAGSTSTISKICKHLLLNECSVLIQRKVRDQAEVFHSADLGMYVQGRQHDTGKVQNQKEY